MKISFVIGTMSGGGAERVVSVLANWFSEKGYDVSIIAIIGNLLSYDINPQIDLYMNNSKIVNKVSRVIDRFKFTRRTFQKVRPDVIISFTTEINIYTLIAKIGIDSRVIISERNDPYNDPPNKITRFIRRMTYWLSDSFVFQTDYAKNYFGTRIRNRSAVIPNPLKETLPEPFNGRRKKEFVTVARLSKQKNLTMLIDGFRRFVEEKNDYILKIYGDGPQREELERYIKTNGLENLVFLMGFQKDVHRNIIDAAAFILTSDYEGISNSMIESLAIGVPTICTDCPAGGARMFIVNKHNGILIPVGDVEALYMAMLEITNNSDLSKKLSQNSVLIRDKLSVKVIAEKWESEIKKEMD